MLPVLLMKQVQTWQIATIHRPCGPTGNGILFQTRGEGPSGHGPSEFKTEKKTVLHPYWSCAYNY
jgi:hypothetical protein